MLYCCTVTVQTYRVELNAASLRPKKLNFFLRLHHSTRFHLLHLGLHLRYMALRMQH